MANFIHRAIARMIVIYLFYIIFLSIELLKNSIISFLFFKKTKQQKFNVTLDNVTLDLL